MDKPTGLQLLRVPFPPNQISKLPKPKDRNSPKGRCTECGGWHGLPAVHLDYVGHAALTDRLLDADPNWTWEPLSMNDGLPVFDGYGGMWIKLTVCGVTRLGYGHAGDKQGGDAIKEVIGDALRNAAMRFGAALDLWHKGDLHEKQEDYRASPAAEIANGWASSQSDEHLSELQELALDIVEAFRKDNGLAAVRMFYGLTDNDEKVYVWDLLKTESKLRTFLKANKPPLNGAQQAEVYRTAESKAA